MEKLCEDNGMLMTKFTHVWLLGEKRNFEELVEAYIEEAIKEEKEREES